MRRKRRKKRWPLKLILIIFVLLSFVSFGYAYLSTVLSIKGRVTGQLSEENYTIAPGSNPNLRISIVKTNTWYEGNLYRYQYSFTVTNIGTGTIENFKITAKFLNDITSIQTWNYEYSINGKNLIINNTNYSLGPNESVVVDFILASPASTQLIRTIKLEVITEIFQVTLAEFNVKFSITSGWGSYTYQYNVTVTNKIGRKIVMWQLAVVLPEGTSYVSGWNADYTQNNNVLTIKSLTYNGNLGNNASTSFGLQLNTNVANFIPSNISVWVRYV